MSEPRYNMIGPVDVPEETSSGLVLLPTNNTLIAMPFKGDNGPRKPELIPNEFSGSTEEIMKYTKPEVKVKLQTGNESNPEVDETLNFQGGVESFSPKAIKKSAPLLRKLEAEFQASEALVGRIDKNAQFRKAIDDPDTRAAIMGMFREVLKELDNSLPDPGE